MLINRSHSHIVNTIFVRKFVLMSERVSIYFRRDEYTELESLAVRLGFRSVYSLVKSTALFFLTMSEEMPESSALSDDGREETLSRVAIRSLASRERRCRVPSTNCNLHPYAVRFTNEEYERLLADVENGGSPSCSLLGKEDVLNNLFFYLYREGDLGCESYEEYKEKALRRIKQ